LYRGILVDVTRANFDDNQCPEFLRCSTLLQKAIMSVRHGRPKLRVNSSTYRNTFEPCDRAKATIRTQTHAFECRLL